MKTVYFSKLPGAKFLRPASGYTRSIDAMRRRIESVYAAGYTDRPYVQLVEETDDEFRVVAEWMPGKGWIGPLQAAGFAPIP